MFLLFVLFWNRVEWFQGLKSPLQRVDAGPGADLSVRVTRKRAGGANELEDLPGQRWPQEA